VHQRSLTRPSPAQSECQCQPSPTFALILVSPKDQVRSVWQSPQVFERAQTLEHLFTSANQQTCRFCQSYPMKQSTSLIHQSLFAVVRYAPQELLASESLDLFTPSRVYL